jgi:1-acyl-sn-glycerol-3-phosphate acyltransferase
MFPEGKINRTSRILLPIRSGAAVVAEKAEAPLIPLLITGSPYRDTVWSPVFMPAHVRITFGTPISSKSASLHETATERSENAREEPESSPQDDSSFNSSDALMYRWGKQMIELAGQPDCPVEFASARKRRQRGKATLSNNS